MTIKDKVFEDMKIAMRAHDKVRLGTIRLIMAALKQREVDEQITLNDEQALSVLAKMIKQRRDSISQYEMGNRQDLASKEAEEILVIQSYLPTQLNMAEIDQLISTAIEETGAISAKDMGKVMAFVKNKAQGSVDMTIVSGKVKDKLAG